MIRERRKRAILSRLNTDAKHCDGVVCSSGEVPVMGLERRGGIQVVKSIATTEKQDDADGDDKQAIHDRELARDEAYKAVKASKGAAGVDGQTLEDSKPI